MKDLTVCFDVDGTLIDWNEQPNQAMIDVCNFFAHKTKNVRVVVWSRRGQAWADETVDKLGITNVTTGEKSDIWQADIAFDDMHSFDMATSNIIVRLK